MAIKPRLPSSLLIGKEDIKISELISDATSTAPSVMSLLDCWAAVIITIESAAGPATNGMANGTTNGSSSFGSLLGSSSPPPNTSLTEMMNKLALYQNGQLMSSVVTFLLMFRSITMKVVL